MSENEGLLYDMAARGDVAGHEGEAFHIFGGMLLDDAPAAVLRMARDPITRRNIAAGVAFFTSTPARLRKRVLGPLARKLFKGSDEQYRP